MKKSLKVPKNTVVNHLNRPISLHKAPYHSNAKCYIDLDAIIQFGMPTQFLDKRIKFIFGVDKWIKLNNGDRIK